MRLDRVCGLGAGAGSPAPRPREEWNSWARDASRLASHRPIDAVVSRRPAIARPRATLHRTRIQQIAPPSPLSIAGPRWRRACRASPPGGLCTRSLRISKASRARVSAALAHESEPRRRANQPMASSARQCAARSVPPRCRRGALASNRVTNFTLALVTAARALGPEVAGSWRRARGSLILAWRGAARGRKLGLVGDENPVPAHGNLPNWGLCPRCAAAATPAMVECGRTQVTSGAVPGLRWRSGTTSPPRRPVARAVGRLRHDLAGGQLPGALPSTSLRVAHSHGESEPWRPSSGGERSRPAPAEVVVAGLVRKGYVEVTDTEVAQMLVTQSRNYVTSDAPRFNAPLPDDVL